MTIQKSETLVILFLVAESSDPISIESIPPTYKFLYSNPLSDINGCSNICNLPESSWTHFTPILLPSLSVFQIKLPVFGIGTVL